MSKKNKSTKQIELPAQYLDVILPDKKRAERKVVLGTDGKFHVFANSQVPVPADLAIEKEWKNFDEFSNQNSQTVLAYHEQFYKCEPPKNQNIVTTALYVWAQIIGPQAVPHLAETKLDGTPERKSSYATRQYFPGSGDPKTTVIKTPQAAACYRIFTDLLGTSPSVTEENLKASVIQRASELKTKQDPWRIFQYYRPTLIKLLLLRHD